MILIWTTPLPVFIDLLNKIIERDIEIMIHRKRKNRLERRLCRRSGGAERTPNDPKPSCERNRYQEF